MTNHKISARRSVKIRLDFASSYRPFCSMGDACDHIAAASQGKCCGIPRYVVGVISIVLVTGLWVGSSFLTKTILSDYDKPFYITYLSCFSFQLYYVFLWIRDPVSPQTEFERRHPNYTKDSSVSEPKEKIKQADLRQEPKRNSSVSRLPSKSPTLVGKYAEFDDKPPLTPKEMMNVGFFLFVLYVFAAYLCNISFQYTSVSSSTIMATTNGIFLLILGVVFGTDNATWIKVLATFISAFGAGLLLYLERPKGWNRLMGNLMALGSSIFYAVYSVLLKKIVKDEYRVSIPILFAVVGTFSTLLLWPVFILLHIYRIEVFQLPANAKEWGSIIVNVFFGSLIPNYLWNVAFMFTTPLVVAIGVSFTVPVTIVAEYFYGDEVVTWVSILTGSLVVAGFLLINYSALYPEHGCDCRVGSCCN